jgi:glycosyltransferase involved in cell wall biosynthesis
MWIGVIAKLIWRVPLIYDTHELWPDRNGRLESRKWLMAAEAIFVRVADSTITTSPGYSQLLARRYRITPPVLVRNLPTGVPLDGLDKSLDSPTLAYAGGLLRGRGLEQAIEVLVVVPEVRLALIGDGHEPYIRELREHARRLNVEDRVEFRGLVPPGEVVNALASAHVGLCLIQPVCRSYELTLPNKLFEYVAAGLPILASDLPVIGDLTRRHDLGEVVPSNDISAIATALQKLLDPTRNAECRRRAAVFASQADWRREREVLAGVYRDVCLDGSPRHQNAQDLSRR